MALTATVPNAQYSFISPRRQLFAFPPDVISSMMENPSSHKGLAKLYQTCKYFYAKQPILITNFVAFLMEIDEDEYLIPDGKLVTEIGSRNWDNNIDVSNLKIPIWPTYEIYFCNELRPLPNFFCYSSIEKLSFDAGDVSFNDFMLLTAEKKINHFRMEYNDSCILHSDGSKATIEQVLQQLPNVKYFTYLIDESCTDEMLVRLNGLKFNHKFDCLRLDLKGIHPAFDVNEFGEFIKKNTTVATKLQIVYVRSLREKLKHAMQKLDPKRKKEAHRGLKLFFFKIDPNWDKEICLVYNPCLLKTPVDEILQERPDILYFQYHIDANCSAKTLQKLNDIKFNHKFEYFKADFFNVPRSFDMNLFCEFVTKNSNAATDIYLYPRVEVKSKLKKALEKLDSTWKTDANDELKQMFRYIDPYWEN